MIRIIKFILSYFTWLTIFKNINIINYKNILNALKTLLMVLPITRVWDLVLDLVRNRIPENSILNTITSKINPALESANVLVDTPLKRITLISFIDSILFYIILNNS